MDTGVDCENEKQFGRLTWVINGKDYSMEASEWVYPPAHYEAGKTPVLVQDFVKDQNLIGGESNLN